MLRSTAGGVAEWLKATVSKTVNGGFVVRGFESLPLRCSRRFACKRVSDPGECSPQQRSREHYAECECCRAGCRAAATRIRRTRAPARQAPGWAGALSGKQGFESLSPAIELGDSHELQPRPSADDAQVRKHQCPEGRLRDPKSARSLGDGQGDPRHGLWRASRRDGGRGWLRRGGCRAATRPWHVGVALRHAPYP